MEGERVQYVLAEWRDLLRSITKKKYLAMLEAHAQSLYATKRDGETPGKFVKRVRPLLIAYEEQTKLYRISGKHANHYYEGLPKWEDVKPYIDNLTAQLDEVLAQPPSSSQPHQTGIDEDPF